MDSYGPVWIGTFYRSCMIDEGCNMDSYGPVWIGMFYRSSMIDEGCNMDSYGPVWIGTFYRSVSIIDEDLIWTVMDQYGLPQMMLDHFHD